MIRVLLLLLLSSGTLFGDSQSLKRFNNSLVIYPSHAPFKAIQLEPISQNIIHITASPVKEIKIDTSLIVIPQRAFTNWSLIERGTKIFLNTSELQIIVSSITGNVRFLSSNGKPLLTTNENETSFEPGLIETGQTNYINQAFASTPLESFFGLGQHQQGLIDYKGEFVELLQNNTEIAIPFLVSSKNYGL